LKRSIRAWHLLSGNPSLIFKKSTVQKNNNNNNIEINSFPWALNSQGEGDVLRTHQCPRRAIDLKQ